MPYKIQRDTKACPVSKPFAVKNKQTDKVMGCFATEQAAQKQMGALHANEPAAKTGGQKMDNLIRQRSA